MSVWNNLVSQVNERRNYEEKFLQEFWENVFSEYFGYKKLFGEIAHNSVQIGSKNAIIPDILIRDAGRNEDRFLVELKRSNYVLDEQKLINAKNQLQSYQKILNIDLGIIICDRIHIYYYFDLQRNDYIDIEITFSKDNELGQKFIDTFSKGNFEKDKIVTMLENINKEKELLIKKDVAHKELENSIDDVLIKCLLTDYFTSQQSVLNENEIVDILDKMNISVNKIADKPVVTSILTMPSSYIGKESCNSLGKTSAKRMFQERGNILHFNCTYASKNKGMNIYWANPNMDYVQREWSLILDDNINRKLYLFKIPQNTFGVVSNDEKNYNYGKNLILRSDKVGSGKIDLQIDYDSLDFMDNRSKQRFREFLVDQIDY